MNNTISYITLIISLTSLLISVINWTRLNHIDKLQVKFTLCIADILDTIKTLTKGNVEILKFLNGKDRHTVRSRSTDKKTRRPSN